MTLPKNMAAIRCHGCHQNLDLPEFVGRRERCPFCGADLHVCMNCRFYEPVAYNACQEPQAERILDKDRANFCDFFSIRQGSNQALGPSSAKGDSKDRLEALFKKT